MRCVSYVDSLMCKKSSCGPNVLNHCEVLIKTSLSAQPQTYNTNRSKGRYFCCGSSLLFLFSACDMPATCITVHFASCYFFFVIKIETEGRNISRCTDLSVNRTFDVEMIHSYTLKTKSGAAVTIFEQTKKWQYL